MEKVTGSPIEMVRRMGVQSVLGNPIVVEGALWGVVVAATTKPDPIPPDTEQRIAAFTELVATAIANAESRAELGLRVEEQAALRRVATQVVRGVPPDEIFAAVAEEVLQLFDADTAAVARFEPDRSEVVVVGLAQKSDEHLPARWKVEAPLATAEVLRTGRPARMDDELRRSENRSAVSSPILVEGNLWGVIAASTKTVALPPDTENRMANFSDVIATAIANAESRAKLDASRARVVVAGAEERQRVVRDLHDGAQQRLVHAVITLKLALRDLEARNGNADTLVSEALEHAEHANSELRELVHGILPGVLTSGGLRAGVEDLASRCSIPLDVDVSGERFSSPIEATAYFVVSEALTNVVKHARAERAKVAAQVGDGVLQVAVSDDGVGGADPARGSGLTGLKDRVEALGGAVEIASPAGHGTTLVARIPTGRE
jgi:signal transduction histidine kinase